MLRRTVVACVETFGSGDPVSSSCCGAWAVHSQVWVPFWFPWWSMLPEPGFGPDENRRCDYEVGDLSWAPQSGLTAQAANGLESAAGGVWGVKL
ncbi:hypothetical protein V2W45_564667 [Cenococcum geophilum]